MSNPFDQFDDNAPNPFDRFDDAGNIGGVVNAGRRAGRGALAAIDVAGALARGNKRDDYLAQADALDQQAESIDSAAPNWTPENRAAWAQRAKGTAAQLRERAAKMDESATASIEGAARHAKAAEEIPISEDYRAYQNAKGWDAVKQFLKNPIELPTTIAVEGAVGSLPAMALSTAGGMAAGPAGVAAGAGLGSYLTEYANTVLDTLRDHEVDTEDGAALKQAFANPELMAEARKRGLARGIPVAAFDAISGGIAGRTVAPVVKRGLRPIVKAGAKEIAEQAGLGMAGETAGQVSEQVATTGNFDPSKLNLGDIAAEGIGELVPGLGEIGVGAAKRKKTGPNDTGRNVPESRATLEAQQAQLVEGRKPAQMFPKGTEELPLPKGMERVETERGVFHFNPELTSAEEIAQASAAGRENEVLGLGPASKADVAESAARGQPLLAVAERDAQGREVKMATATPDTAPAALAEMERTKTPGNTVAPEPIERAVRERPGGASLIDELTAADDAATERARNEQAAESKRRTEAQGAAYAKKETFDERHAVALDVLRRPEATLPEVQGARTVMQSYAEDNSVGLTQPQREAAHSTFAQLAQRESALRPAEEARRAGEQAAAARAALEAEAAKKAERKTAREDFKAAEQAGMDAAGRPDYPRLPDERLAELAQGGDKQAERTLMQRGATEGDHRESLLDALRRVKLPTTDPALGTELRLLKEEMSERQRLTLVDSKAKRGLDATAEALREAGFSSIKTPADVIDAAQRALRGEDVRADHAQADFGTSRAPQPAPIAATPQELAAIRRAFPELARDYDLEIGDVPKALRARGYTGPVPTTAEAALLRSGQRSLLVLAARAYRDRGKGAALLAHEVAHAYWHTLPEQTRALLRQLHAQEIDSRTGPLYRDGKLRSELDHIEERSERGAQEWFAERIARLNEQWARGRIDRTEQPLLLRLASQLREWLQTVWSRLAKSEGRGADRMLFVEEFRRFMSGGADALVGRKAGLAYAERARVDLATGRAQTETPAFKAWFGDSKVVDAEGKPLVVYHGTDTKFRAFDSEFSADGAFWFTSDRAKITGGESGAAGKSKILPVYLAARKLAGWPEYERMSLSELQRAGFDGVKLDDDFIVFQPTQIKSATANRGTFAPNDPRIDFATGKDDKAARHAELDVERQSIKTELRRLENGVGDPKREAALRAQLAATDAEFAALDREQRPQAYTPPSTPEAIALRERYDARRDAFDRTAAEADALRAELNTLLQTDEAADFPRVRALRDQVREADAATRKIYDELVALRGELDQANPTRGKMPEGKTTQQVMDELLRVENAPGPGRRDALIAEWRYGRQLAAEGKRTGNAAAQEEGKRLVDGASARLNEEYPGWQKEQNKPAPAPPPPAPEPAGLDDAEKSPFAEPARDLPVRPGHTANVYGHSAHTPSFLARNWQRVRGLLTGFRGAVPELPAFPDAKWNRSDPFIAREGPRFYDRMKAFSRALKSQNDHVQHTAAENVGKVTAELLDSGGKIDARGYARLADLQEKSRALKAEGKPLPAPLAAELTALQSKLEAHPYVLFERLVLMLDLRWRAQNLKDSAGKPILLPGGINEAEIAAELQRLAQKIEASPQRDAIRRAAEAHRALVKRVADDLQSRELLAVDALRNPWYFPHLTLQTSRDGKTTERELRPARVRPGTEADFRGYLIEPTGSVKPIETDYVRAMYYHLVQVGAHNAKADAVRFYARPYDVMNGVRETAARLSRERGQTVSWEQAFHEVYAPQGFVLYGADSGDAFSQVTVDRDRLAHRLGVMLTGEDLHKQLADLGMKGVKLLPEDLREVMQQGQRETWVVPARIAEALRGMAERADAKPGLIDATLKHAVGAWKAWKLFMPSNHVRYEYGNLVADLEKLFSAAPGTFRQMPQAARELRALWLGGQPSDLLRAALKENVINAVTAQELNALRASPLFRQFETGGEKAWAEFKAWASAPLANLTRIKDGGLLGRVTSVEESAFREGVFRYAKFLSDYKAMEAGARPEYAGAAFREIDAMGDSAPGAGDAKVRKAAAISKATFGDYGDLSVSGQALRDKLIPFYSWMEVNFRYHANLLRNLRDMVRAGEASNAEAAKAGARAAAVFAAGFGARAAGGIALRLAVPYAAVVLWNSTGDRDDLEKLLSEEDRRRFHVILGVVGDDASAIDGTRIVKLGDGRRVRVAYANTALLDVIKWASGPAFAQQMGRWLNGKADFATAAAAWRDQLAPDLVNNLVGGLGPALKLPYTILAKKNVFPDALDQRSIPAYDMRRNIIGQMTDDFTADLIERAINKDYYAAKDLGSWATQLILQVRERDPESWAFYAIKDKAAQFKEKATGAHREGGSYDAPDQQVLRNFRRAIYRGDADNAVRFYLRLLDYGYTAERFAAGIQSQDPLHDLPKETGLRRAFVESLDETDREMLDRAYAYYTRMTSSRGREAALFPRKATGERGLERYRANPPTEGLRRLVEMSAAITDPEREQRALFEERRSLQRR